MEFLNSLKKRSKRYDSPFSHWELNKPLTEESINDKSSTLDKKTDGGDLKEKGDQTSSESNSDKEAEREVLIEAPLPDGELDEEAEEKGGEEIKK